MKERRAVERVIERVYKDRLMRTGRLPDSREVRKIEDKVKKAAQESDNRKSRR